MPLWLTTAIGLTGSIVGAVVARALFDDSGYVVSFGSLFVAIALVAVYRRYVQHRPVWGAEARRFPERGFGVGEQRERLRKLGIDPDRVGRQRVPAAATSPPPAAAGDPVDHLLALLSELHREDVLDDDEYAAKRELVLERQRRSAT